MSNLSHRREAIVDLLTRCQEAERRTRPTEIAGCFAVDGVLVGCGRTDRGRRAIQRSFESLLLRPRMAGTPTWPSVQRALVATDIDFVSQHEAQCVSEYVVTSRLGFDHRGQIVDTVRLVGGEWRIAHRRITVDAAVRNSAAWPHVSTARAAAR